MALDNLTLQQKYEVALGEYHQARRMVRRAEERDGVASTCCQNSGSK